MSGLDIYEDGFPHSTKEGYARGCKGGACPGIVDYGFSCRQAEVRYHGDYAFAKLVDAGKSPAEIVEIERAAVPAPSPKKAPEKRKLTASGDTPITPTITVADSVEPIPAPEPAVPVLAPEDTVLGKNGRPIAMEFHGTRSGYQRGCHGTVCPGLKTERGKTCRRAAAEYQAELMRKYRERAEGTERSEPEPVEEPTSPAGFTATVPGSAENITITVPQQPGTFDEPTTGKGVRTEGLLSDLADARERVAQLEAELAVYQRDPFANEQIVMTLSFIKGRLSAVKVS